MAADVLDSAWVSAGAGFLGAIIGAGAALGSQFITQNAIAERERRERTRKEKRVRALFATRLEEVQAFVSIAVTGKNLGQQIIDAYTPLAAIADDASLSLCLTPDEIYAVATALAALKVNYRLAAEQAALHEQQREKATSRNVRDTLDQEFLARLSTIYTVSYDALNDALVQLGRKPVARFGDNTKPADS